MEGDRRLFHLLFLVSLDLLASCQIENVRLPWDLKSKKKKHKQELHFDVYFSIASGAKSIGGFITEQRGAFFFVGHGATQQEVCVVYDTIFFFFLLQRRYRIKYSREKQKPFD